MRRPTSAHWQARPTLGALMSVKSLAERALTCLVGGPMLAMTVSLWRSYFTGAGDFYTLTIASFVTALLVEWWRD